MGQYWVVVNIDKKEYIDPHVVGCGLKVTALLMSPGVGQALVILCACPISMGEGSGDLDMDFEVSKSMVGRWSGDRIAIVGDYNNEKDGVEQWLEPDDDNTCAYDRCGNPKFGYTNISLGVASVIEEQLEGKFVGDGCRKWKS